MDTWTHEPPELQKFCTLIYNKHRNLHTFRFALRYWLRFLPWVRTNWIVTNIAPCWLNTTNSNIVIVKHVDIWPEHIQSRDLPTYVRS